MIQQLRGLAQQSIRQILDALTKLDPSVTVLDLSFNSLHLRPLDELVQLFAMIPAHITSLDLTANTLGNKNVLELAVAIAAIPSSVTSLDLSHNGFFNQNIFELTPIMAKIKPSVTHLSLRGCLLSRHTIIPLDFVKVFQGLPASIKSLDFSYNEFYKNKSTDLIQILAAIPVTLTSINLDDSHINPQIAADIVNILNKIKPDLRSINFGKQGAYNADKTKLIALNPSAIDNPVLISKADRHFIEFFAQRLMSQIDEVVLEGKLTFLLTQPLVPEADIDEPCFNAIIKQLEALNTPAARLTAAILLSGLIETTLEDLEEEEKTTDNVFKIKEQRTLRGIELYIQTKKTPLFKTIKSAIGFILWHLKTTTQADSATPMPLTQKRLATETFTPKKTMPSYRLFKQIKPNPPLGVPGNDLNNTMHSELARL